MSWCNMSLAHKVYPRETDICPSGKHNYEPEVGTDCFLIIFLTQPTLSQR